MSSVMDSLAVWLAGADLTQVEKDNILVIGAGIDGLLKIKYTYFGKSRVVEPYVVTDLSGIGAVVNCYQTGGSSNGARIIGWKTFRVANMENCKVLSEVFEVRSFYYAVPFFWGRSRIIWVP